MSSVRTRLGLASFLVLAPLGCSFQGEITVETQVYEGDVELRIPELVMSRYAAVRAEVAELGGHVRDLKAGVDALDEFTKAWSTGFQGLLAASRDVRRHRVLVERWPDIQAKPEIKGAEQLRAQVDAYVKEPEGARNRALTRDHFKADDATSSLTAFSTALEEALVADDERQAKDNVPKEVSAARRIVAADSSERARLAHIVEVHGRTQKQITEIDRLVTSGSTSQKIVLELPALRAELNLLTQDLRTLVAALAPVLGEIRAKDDWNQILPELGAPADQVAAVTTSLKGASAKVERAIPAARVSAMVFFASAVVNTIFGETIVETIDPADPRIRKHRAVDPGQSSPAGGEETARKRRRGIIEVEGSVFADERWRTVYDQAHSVADGKSEWVIVQESPLLYRVKSVDSDPSDVVGLQVAYAEQALQVITDIVGKAAAAYGFQAQGLLSNQLGTPGPDKESEDHKQAAASLARAQIDAAKEITRKRLDARRVSDAPRRARLAALVAELKELGQSLESNRVTLREKATDATALAELNRSSKRADELRKEAAALLGDWSKSAKGYASAEVQPSEPGK